MYTFLYIDIPIHNSHISSNKDKGKKSNNEKRVNLVKNYNCKTINLRSAKDRLALASVSLFPYGVQKKGLQARRDDRFIRCLYGPSRKLSFEWLSRRKFTYYRDMRTRD